MLLIREKAKFASVEANIGKLAALFFGWPALDMNAGFNLHTPIFGALLAFFYTLFCFLVQSLSYGGGAAYFTKASDDDGRRLFAVLDLEYATNFDRMRWFHSLLVL